MGRRRLETASVYCPGELTGAETSRPSAAPEASRRPATLGFAVTDWTLGLKLLRP